MKTYLISLSILIAFFIPYPTQASNTFISSLAFNKEIPPVEKTKNKSKKRNKRAKKRTKKKLKKLTKGSKVKLGYILLLALGVIIIILGIVLLAAFLPYITIVTTGAVLGILKYFTWIVSIMSIVIGPILIWIGILGIFNDPKKEKVEEPKLDKEQIAAESKEKHKNLPFKTLERHIDLKVAIYKLEEEKVLLEKESYKAEKVNYERLKEEIVIHEGKIKNKQREVDYIEDLNEKLADVPFSKRKDYVAIKDEIFKLNIKKEKLEELDDDNSKNEIKKIEILINENQADLDAIK